MKLLFATTNLHKFHEMRALLREFPVELVGLSDGFLPMVEPEEDGLTFEENARIKARAYARATNLVCLADDSGLQVDALGGAPGVHSARYAGGPKEGRAERNRQKLLSELKSSGNAERSARLICALCVARANGEVLFEAQGACEGEIIDSERGNFGIGYDSLLYLPERGRTAAEVAPDVWNVFSHRGTAGKKLLAWLQGNQASRTL